MRNPYTDSNIQEIAQNACFVFGEAIDAGTAHMVDILDESCYFPVIDAGTGDFTIEIKEDFKGLCAKSLVEGVPLLFGDGSRLQIISPAPASERYRHKGFPHTWRIDGESYGPLACEYIRFLGGTP